MNTPKIRILQKNFRNDKIRIRICYFIPKTPEIVRIYFRPNGMREHTFVHQCAVVHLFSSTLSQTREQELHVITKVHVQGDRQTPQSLSAEE